MDAEDEVDVVETDDVEVDAEVEALKVGVTDVVEAEDEEMESRGG